MSHPNSRPYIILINGQSCTGKTQLLKDLSKDLQVPYLSRDEIKEQLFNELGIGDSEWSKKLGGASYSLFFSFLDKLLLAGSSFILEGNFNPIQHREKFKNLFDQHGFDSFEVLLVSDSAVLFERFKARWESGERHRGHADHERFVEFESRLKEDKGLPLSLGGTVIKIDTTDFNNPDLKSLKDQLKKLKF